MWRTIDSLDWSFDGLSRSWSVSLGAARHGDPGTHVGRCRREAPRWFEVLSQEIDSVARDYFGGPPDPSLSPAAQDAIPRLKALGVRTGSPIDTMTGNRPIILVGTVGTADGRSLNEVVTEAALTNIDKLRRAEADERHLLVWVDSTDNASEVAMVNFSLPQEAPDLPDGLDGVWLALWMRGQNIESNVHSLWHFVPGNQWHLVRVPATRSYEEAITTACGIGDSRRGVSRGCRRP